MIRKFLATLIVILLLALLVILIVSDQSISGIMEWFGDLIARLFA